MPGPWAAGVRATAGATACSSRSPRAAAGAAAGTAGVQTPVCPEGRPRPGSGDGSPSRGDALGGGRAGAPEGRVLRSSLPPAPFTGCACRACGVTPAPRRLELGGELSPWARLTPRLLPGPGAPGRGGEGTPQCRPKPAPPPSPPHPEANLTARPRRRDPRSLLRPWAGGVLPARGRPGGLQGDSGVLGSPWSCTAEEQSSPRPRAHLLGAASTLTRAPHL